MQTHVHAKAASVGTASSPSAGGGKAESRFCAEVMEVLMPPTGPFQCAHTLDDR